MSKFNLAPRFVSFNSRSPISHFSSLLNHCMPSVIRIAASLVLVLCLELSFSLTSLSAATPTDEDSVQLNGELLDQDGKPAANGTVQLIVYPYHLTETKTNADGKFSVQVPKEKLGFFSLVAQDSTNQKISVFVRRGDLQSKFDPSERIVMNLSAAKTVRVKVKKGGKPVLGASVYGMYDSYTPLIRSITDKNGEAILRTDEVTTLTRFWAFTEDQGVAYRNHSGEQNKQKIDPLIISLLPRRTCVTSVVDENAKPIQGLLLAPTVRFEKASNDLIMPLVPETYRETNEKGMVKFDFIPSEPSNIFFPNVLSSEYRHKNHWDEGFDHIRIQVKKLPPKFRVRGKVVGAPMERLEGIEISGNGYHLKHGFQKFLARTNSSGEFTVEVIAGQKFNVMAVGDDFASVESELRLTNERGEQVKPLQIEVKPATIVTLSMTQGVNERRPVKSTFFILERELTLVQKGLDGKVQRANTRHRFSRVSDERGVAKIGLSPGTWKVSANLKRWEDEKTVTIGSDGKSMAIDFHANVTGKRKLTGTFMINDPESNGRPDQMSGGLLTLYDLSNMRDTYTGKITKDGSWSVEGEFGKEVAIYAASKDKKYAAIRFVDTSKNRPIAIDMMKASIITGTLVDDQGKPLANHSLVLRHQHRKQQTLFYGESKSDKDGKFEILGVVPRITQKMAVKLPDARYTFVGSDFRLKQDEDRDNVQAIFIDRFKRTMGKPKPTAQNVDASTSLKNLVRYSDLAGLRSLVLIHQDTKESKLLAANIINLDDEKPDLERDIFHFLPKSFSIKDFEKNPGLQKSFLTDEKDIASKSAVIAIILDSNQNVIDRIAIADLRSGLPAARRMLAKTKLPQLDAKAEYKKKLLLAKETGKTLFFVEGGPRCGPCFALLDWYDKNRSVMDKHFVLFKFSRGMKKGMEICKKIRGDELGGIPWHCFLDSSGQKMGTSDGPLGNVGFPAGSKTSIDHFIKTIKQSRKSISDTDLNELRKSLE